MITDESRRRDDDSAFLSMADFFSLLSLTFIYLAIAFGSPHVGKQSMAVVAAVPSPKNETLAPDPTAAFVSIMPANGGVLVRVIPPFNGANAEQTFQLPFQSTSNEVGATSIADWVASQIELAPKTRQIVILVAPNESRPEALAAFVEVARRSSDRFPVLVIPK